MLAEVASSRKSSQASVDVFEKPFGEIKQRSRLLEDGRLRLNEWDDL